jgi:H+-transporting ATPase
MKVKADRSKAPNENQSLKTGIQQVNNLALGDAFCVEDVAAWEVILTAALASRADENDPVDLAILAEVKNRDAFNSYELVRFQPFGIADERSEATVKAADGKTFKVTKGTPQAILALASNASEVRLKVENAVSEFAAKGFCSIGVARSDCGGKWLFLGVLPLFGTTAEK